MTYKERAEMMNLRQRVEAQREEIRKLREFVEKFKSGNTVEEEHDDINQDEGRP